MNKAKETRQSGVITVFAAASILLIISLILTLLEGARVSYSDTLFQQQVHYGVQSYMGQYNETLFREYGIYGADSRLWGTERETLEMLCGTEKGDLGLSFLKEADSIVENLEYRLLTDDGASDFRKQAFDTYMYEIPETLIEELQSQNDLMETIGDEEYEQLLISKAEEALDKAKELNEGNADGERTGAQVLANNRGEDFVVENPIEDMKQSKESFVLSMVLPQDFQVSTGSLKREKGLEEQDLSEGTMTGEKSSEALADMVFPLYLQNHFSCALESEESTLKYQQEYLIIGARTDRENLEGVVKRLITVRELTWFAYRLTDEASRQQALAIATSLMGAVSLPALIKPVEMGILLAWSYEDAIEDVKKLMAGEKVYYLPGQAQDINKEFSYEQFLRMLMMVKNKEILAYRSLDILEEVMEEKGIAFKANQTVTGIEGNMVMKLPSIFTGITEAQREGVFPISRKYSFRQNYS